MLTKDKPNILSGSRLAEIKSNEGYDYSLLFPILQNNRNIVFLDSAATTQKPLPVLQAERQYLETMCANSGRGSYPWAYQTSELVANARARVAQFIGGRQEEVIFTSGATISLNLVALAWGQANLKDQDEILYCSSDHKALNLPWFLLQQNLAKTNINIKLKPYSLLSTGEIDIQSLINAVSPRTRLVNLSHVSNVAGVVNDIRHVRNLLPDCVLLNLDCAQSIAHMPINVSELGADFVSFSGHKAYASTGIGVLWVRKDHHSHLKPIFDGGGHTESLDPTLTSLFEFGTLNISGIVSLNAALHFMDAVGLDVIREHSQTLVTYLQENLGKNEQVNFIYPDQVSPEHRAGLLSFNVIGYSSTSVGDYLSSNDIFVRHGTHCAGITSQVENPPTHDSVRVSLGIYNSKSDIDKLVQLLDSLPRVSIEADTHFS